MLTADSERPQVAVKTAGEGTAYILLHGGMGSWNHWARNIDALADHFQVRAVDLPGYGDSPDVDKTILIVIACSVTSSHVHLTSDFVIFAVRGRFW